MKKIYVLALAIGAMMVGCNKSENTEDNIFSTKVQPVSKLWEDTNVLFKPISSVSFNGISEDKILLGKKLYSDTRLSKDGNISCNSCHKLDGFGVDNLSKSPGDLGKLGGRNSPTSFYAALHAKQFWDGRAKDVEEQAGGPVLNPVEHNIPSEEFLEERLRAVPEYQEMFKKAFPEDENPVNFKNMRFAIAAFEKQLMPESRFDKYLDGDETALNIAEKEGLKSFISNGCTACHSGVALGGELFQKFGVFGNYWEYTKSKDIDNGLYDVTKKEGDKYIFKVPSLRNIEKTNPYFHDGSIDKLDDAVKIMAKLQLNKDLPEQEVKSIVTFLKTLTADIDDKYKK